MVVVGTAIIQIIRWRRRRREQQHHLPSSVPEPGGDEGGAPTEQDLGTAALDFEAVKEMRRDEEKNEKGKEVAGEEGGGLLAGMGGWLWPTNLFN